MGVRDQGYLVGPNLVHQRHERGDGVPFDVEFGMDAGPDVAHIGIADVAFIGTGMHGNAFGAEGLAVQGGFRHIGNVATAGIAQGGYFVDIDT